jgi:hypothetical protein
LTRILGHPYEFQVGGGRLICAGDGKQEEQAAAALGLPFVKVAGPADLAAALELAG